jgi:hypothetical protein
MKDVDGRIGSAVQQNNVACNPNLRALRGRRRQAAGYGPGASLTKQTGSIPDTDNEWQVLVEQSA